MVASPVSRSASASGAGSVPGEVPGRAGRARRSCGRCWAEGPLYRPASQSATGPSSPPPPPEIRHGERRAGPGPAALPPDWGSRQSGVDVAAHPCRHQAPGTGTSSRARHRSGQGSASPAGAPCRCCGSRTCGTCDQLPWCSRAPPELEGVAALPPTQGVGRSERKRVQCPDAAAARTKAEGHRSGGATQDGDKGVAPVRPAATSGGVQIDAQASLGVTSLLRMAKGCQHVAWRQRDDGRGRIGFLG